MRLRREKVKYRRVLVCLLPFLAAACGAWAAGGRTHMEMGKRAWLEYLLPQAAILPGIEALFNTDETRRAFYCGCYFPDWGYRGINADAAEDSHWRDFENAHFDVLKRALPSSPWNEDARQRIAFFMGSITHGVTDIPWHFNDGPFSSMLGKAKETDNIDHTGCEIGTEIFVHVECPAMPEMAPENARRYYWPLDDMMAAFNITKRHVTREQLNMGCNLLMAASTAGGQWLPLLYDGQKKKAPWTNAHYEDYYYGGIEHGAALTAMWVRYWYARFEGWHCLQNMPVYERKPPEYFAHAWCADTTIAAGEQDFNAGCEPLLEVAANRRSLIRFDLADLARDMPVNDAKLYLYFAARHGEQNASMRVAVYKVNVPWQEGVRQTDDVTGVAGTPAALSESTWRAARHNQHPWKTPGCDAVPEDRDEAPIDAIMIAPNDATDTWRAFDITTLVRQWAANPETNCGILLAQAEPATGAVQFISSQAFKARRDGYCGGRRVAFRPMLVLR